MSPRRRSLALLGSFAVAVGIIGCGAQQDALEDGFAGATATGDAGRAGTGAQASAGAGGGLRGGSGGMLGGGAGGGDDNGGSGPGGTGIGIGGQAGGVSAGSGGSGQSGNGGTPVGNAFGQFCEMPYDQNAPWPGAGRCADRGGRRNDVGPKQLLAVQQAALGSPVRTTPIVGSTYVFVATDAGVFRLARDVEAEAKVVRLKGQFASEPVLAGDRVFAISRDGKLHFASQSGPDDEKTVDLATPGEKAPDEAAGWTSPPLLANGMLMVASPFGELVRVVLGDTPKVLVRVPTSGAASGGALTVDRKGAVYLPTTVGVFRFSSDGTQIEIFGKAPVASTPIATADGALFADVTGQLHRVVASLDTKSDSSELLGATLPANPGAFASFDDKKYSIATGKSLQVLTLNDTDEVKGPALDAVDGEAYYTTSATLFSAPAIDLGGRQYVASSDGALYVIGDGGTLLDSFLTEGALLAQPALVPNGLYLGSTDGNVYYFTDIIDPPPGGSGGGAGSGGAAGAAAGSAGAGGKAGGAAGAGGKAGSAGAGGLSGTAGKGNGGNGGTL